MEKWSESGGGVEFFELYRKERSTDRSYELIPIK